MRSSEVCDKTFAEHYDSRDFSCIELFSKKYLTLRVPNYVELNTRPMKTAPFLLVLLLPFCLYAQDANPRHYTDSLLTELSHTRNDTARIMLLHDISYAMSNIDPDEGIKYATMAATLSEKLVDKKWLASSDGMLAINYNAKSDAKSAIAWNEKALKIYKALHDEKRSAAIHANLSLIHLNQSHYAEALKNAFAALKIYENSKANKNTAIVLENIGHIYFEQKDYTKTEDYYNRALDIYKSDGVASDVARATGNLARVYQARSDYRKALTYLFESLKTNEKAGLKNSIQNNFANIGNVYSKLGDYPKAIEYHTKALQISKEMGNANSIAVNLGNLGCTWLEMARQKTATIPQNPKTSSYLPLAITNLEQAITICRKTGFSAPLSEFNQSLIDAYALSGNYKNAFNLQKSNTELKDSIFSLQSKVALSDLETKRDLELKNKDIIIHQKLLQISELKSDKQRFAYLSGILVLGALFCGLVVFVVRRSRSHKTEMAHIINIQSHKVRGPVATLLGLSELLLHKEPEDPEHREMLEGIHVTASELDQVITDVINKRKDIDVIRRKKHAQL
jgi:tetratricopeptide (TPR) repeat protein